MNIPTVQGTARRKKPTAQLTGGGTCSQGEPPATASGGQKSTALCGPVPADLGTALYLSEPSGWPYGRHDSDRSLCRASEPPSDADGTPHPVVSASFFSLTAA